MPLIKKSSKPVNIPLTWEELDSNWDYIQESLNMLAGNPTYNPAALYLSIDPADTKEIGQNVMLTLTPGFVQNDAGPFISMYFRKDDGGIGGIQETLDPIVTNLVYSATPVLYKAIASHGQGPIKNNNLGQPVSTGQIPAGEVESNIISERGWHTYRFGPTAALPTTGTEGRALPQSHFENDNSHPVLNTGTAHKIFAVVVLPGKKLNSVKDKNTNAVLTYPLINANFNGRDRGGVTIAGCKLYALQVDVPYSTNHEHELTIVPE